MEKVIKIGTNRDKARLWLEGKCLEHHGWTKGTRFECYFQPASGKIIYEKEDDGIRKVAGTDKRPVIDTNTDKIKDVADPFTHMKVTITDKSIVFTPCDKPDSLLKKAGKTLAMLAACAAPLVTQFKPDAMKVLVGCEESGRVREAFTKQGHDAVSCDIMDTSDPNGWHIKDDVLNHIDGDWDLGIFFPPCTYLTVSAAWAFKDPDYEKYPEIGYHQRVKAGTLTGEARRIARDEAVAFVDTLYNSNIPKVSIENPRGSLSKLFRKPDQVIQPYEFGDPESKTTCLWLKGLKPLVPTNVLDIEEHGYLAKNGVYRWMNQTPTGQSNLPPTPDRDIIRSKTYPGIAQAMAEQWGGGHV